jgi:ribosomal protein S21
VRDGNIDQAISRLKQQVAKDGDLRRLNDRLRGRTHSKSDKRKLKKKAADNRRRKREAMRAGRDGRRGPTKR